MFVYFWVVTTKEIFSLFFLFIFFLFIFLPYHFFLDGLENRTKPVSTPYDGWRWWDAGGTRTCVHPHVSRPLYHCATDCACCSTLCMCYTHKFCAVVFHSALLRVLWFINYDNTMLLLLNSLQLCCIHNKICFHTSIWDIFIAQIKTIKIKINKKLLWLWKVYLNFHLVEQVFFFTCVQHTGTRMTYPQSML